MKIAEGVVSDTHRKSSKLFFTKIALFTEFCPKMVAAAVEVVEEIIEEMGDYENGNQIRHI